MEDCVTRWVHYRNQKIPVLGAVMVPVKYGNQQQELEAPIVLFTVPGVILEW